MQHGATAIGLSLLAVSVVALVVALSRGGQVRPFLRSDGAQTGFLMVLILLFFVGAALALFGFPAGIQSSGVR